MHESSVVVEECHCDLPPRIGDYLRYARGISLEVVDRHLLGWNSNTITIPIFDRGGKFV